MSSLIERHHLVASTMDVAKERAAQGAPEWTTIVAAEQTAGRGRRGRAWFSPPAGGLYLTVILRPVGHTNVETLSLVAGVAAAAACHRLGVTAARLKWPNDLQVGKRKLAGILLEAQELGTAQATIFVGIGVNVSSRAQLELPPEIHQRYTGIGDYVGGREAREQLLSHLLAELRAGYEQWKTRGIEPTLEAWQRWDWLAGRPIVADSTDGAVRGRAAGIDATGGLRIATDDGLVVVRTGEVTLLQDTNGGPNKSP